MRARKLKSCGWLEDGGVPARKKMSFLHVYYASFWYKNTQIKPIKLLKYTIKIVKILK